MTAVNLRRKGCSTLLTGSSSRYRDPYEVETGFMKALILAGSDVTVTEALRDLCQNADFVVAADSGVTARSGARRDA